MSKNHFRASAVASVGPNSTAYTSGDLIGAKLTLTGLAPCVGFGGKIESVVLSDLAKQSLQVDVVFFDSNPAATTFTNNSALDIADADLTKVAGVISLNTTSYAAFNDNSVATAADCGLAYKLNATSVIYAALVARSAPTYASSSDLQLKVQVTG